MRCSLFTAATMAAVSIFSVSATSAELQLAQVDVVESSPLIRAIGQQRQDNANRNANSNSSGETASNLQSELYYQLQVLQQEVQGLRGLVEEQAHQLQQLKQQRMDDYMDLDRRISELSQAGGRSSDSSASRNANGASTDRPARDRTPASNNTQSGEFASYSAAVDLATKRQEFDSAIAALNKHLEEYPQGDYAPNAHYWLGQIYFVQGNMEEAKQAFSRVVNTYSSHNKAPEARYKLGQVYFRLGEKARAKTLLDEVANGNSDSAALAKNFLRQNY